MAAIELVGTSTANSDVIGRMDFVQVLSGPAYQTNARIAGTRGGDLVFLTNPSPTLTERMRILSNGNVGVNTNNPLSQFEVATDGSLTNGLRVSNSTTTVNGPSIYFDAANIDWTITGSNAGNGSGADKLVFRNYTGANDLMALTSAGNLGIGTTSPQNRLQVHGGASLSYGQFTNTITGSAATDGLWLGVNSLGDGYLTYGETGAFRIQSNGITAIQMNNVGHVGIGGAPDASHTLLVYGSNESIGVDNTGITIGDVNGNSFGNYMYVDFEATPRFLFMGANIGVGMTNPTEQLDIANGNVRINGNNDYKYSTPKTHYLSVPGSSFSMENTSVCDRALIGGNAYTVGGSAIAVAYMVAPVNLPDGATITSITYYVVDNDATYNLQNGQLWRNDGSVTTSYGNSSTMATIAPPASTNSTLVQTSSTSSITNPVVDNQNYAYWLRWGTQQANSNMRLVKVVITYTVSKVD